MRGIWINVKTKPRRPSKGQRMYNRSINVIGSEMNSKESPVVTV